MTILDDLEKRLEEHGLRLRGAFHVEPDDVVPENTMTVALTGNAGPSMWESFAENRQEEPHSLDAWTKRVVGKIAADLGGRGVYPSDGPPYFPFQKWAARAEPIYSSP